MPLHSHKCPDRTCNRIWEHDTAEIANDSDLYSAAHKCPDCGCQQRSRFFTDKYEEAIFNLERRIEKVRILQKLDKLISETNDDPTPEKVIEIVMMMIQSDL